MLTRTKQTSLGLFCCSVHTWIGRQF